MTATNPRSRTLPRLASVAGLAALLALAGCKSTKDGDAAPTGGRRDPLVSGPRIPPQNVPLPERGGVAGAKNTKSDPLLERPVGRGGSGYSDDPERFKGTFIPGAGSTPAAMASKFKDGDDLKIDDTDDRVPLRPAGGTAGDRVTPAAAVVEPPADLDPLYAQLQRYDVAAADRSLKQENGRYVFRAAVPLRSGAKRHYEGIGTTPTEAVKQVLDQVATDPRD